MRWSERNQARWSIVTGASSGIGRALALRLGLPGYRVGLIARAAKQLEAAAAAIARAGGQALRRRRRRCRPLALRAAVARSKAGFGPADVMVANAGFGVPTQLDPLNIDDIEQTFRVNVLGVIYSIEAVLPGCSHAGAGSCWRSRASAASRDCPASRPTAPARRR